MPKIRNKIAKLGLLFLLVAVGYVGHVLIYLESETGILNKGISFGVEMIFLIPILLMVIPVATWYWVKEESVSKWLVLILAGGYINLIDRLRFNGAVSDYWLIPGTKIYNNLADWLIFGGSVMYMVKLLKENK